MSRLVATGEHFYGFGEKLTPLDRRGQAMTLWNTDAYSSTYGGFAPDADLLYQSIPFFLGLRGAVAYGLFTDNSYQTHFDMGGAVASTYSVSAAGGAVDQYLVAGPAMADVLQRYTWLTGRMPLPARWALGYHQSRWGYSPDTEVESICQTFRSHDIPADGIWLDIQHMDGDRSFTWDPTTFSDPSGLISDVAGIGFKTTVIEDPGIKQDLSYGVYESGLDAGVFVMSPDAGGASPYIGQAWPGNVAFPDFTSPSTRAWWGTTLGTETAKGALGLWIDMNEPSDFTGPGGTVPDDLPVNGDGTPTTFAEAHNVYGLEEARATYDGMLAQAPGLRPFIVTRAAYAGVQRYAAAWTGDSPSRWDVLSETLPELLGMGLSGEPFVGSDVGGYSGQATDEMFARWIELGGLSPFFRGHTVDTGNWQEPWQFGPEVEAISRSIIDERYQYLPYIYSLFHETSQDGAPVPRPVVFEFQTDTTAATLSDEAMLGPWLLYAPVLFQDPAPADPPTLSRPVYLPAGRWFELYSGAVTEGPATITVSALTYAARPAYVREGAIVPHLDTMQWSDQEAPPTLYLDVYPSTTASSFTLYEDDGSSLDYQSGAYSLVTYSLQGSSSGAELQAGGRTGSFTPAARELVIRVRRVDSAPTSVTFAGATLASASSYEALLSAGTGYFWDSDDLSLVVAFPDTPSFDLVLAYDPTLEGDAPPVSVSFEVTVPADTPSEGTVAIGSSTDGWSASAATLAWSGAGTVTGQMSVPRGQWFFYKYTRGSWSTVEVNGDCSSLAKNRYGFGQANPVRVESVAAWQDICP